MRETTVSLVPKEEIISLKDDQKFIECITNELTKAIVERLIQVLETNDEIIIKKPVLRVSDYWPTKSVEYRKSVDWEPLVRCKDCEQHDQCLIEQIALNDKTFFCKWGKRKEESLPDCGTSMKL